MESGMGKMDNKLVYKFCLESLLPGILNAWGDKEKLLDIVLRRANRDTMAGARFKYDGYAENKDFYIGKLKEIIESGQQLSSIEIIKELERAKKGANIGSIQKLVNMTLKYLYVLQVYGVDFGIDPSGCDCPLDSIILNDLDKKTEKKHTKWTQIKDLNDYKSIQDDIAKQPEAQGSKLFYDFYCYRQ